MSWATELNHTTPIMISEAVTVQPIHTILKEKNPAVFAAGENIKYQILLK